MNKPRNNQPVKNKVAYRTGSVSNCPQTSENPPQLKPKEKSSKSQTTKQGKRITAYYSETNPQTTWLSGYPKIINVLASMENNGRKILYSKSFNDRISNSTNRTVLHPSRRI